VNPLTYFIAGPNERYVDLSTSDINETKAKQKNHVIKNNQYKQQQQQETMRHRERETDRDDEDER
jgi:hypothetical protein